LVAQQTVGLTARHLAPPVTAGRTLFTPAISLWLIAFLRLLGWSMLYVPCGNAQGTTANTFC
ncbi:hypothetical protein, partial [Dickeya dianthicola]